MITSVTVRGLSLGAALTAALTASVHAQSQRPTVTGAQRATAEQVASQGGVPVGELAPDAPDVYAVKRGDTLWRIAGIYLQHPWRWPELWGMNMQAIANPHLIYPGQMLYLDKSGGFARLGTAPGSANALDDGEPPLVRVSPATRSQSLIDAALPTLEPHLIEPFLAEPLIVDADTLAQAPRIVATTDQHKFMTTGDRAYARGPADAPLLRSADGERYFRVFRDAVPLKDPVSGEILGYEAQYLGNAELVAGESQEVMQDGGTRQQGQSSQTLAQDAHHLANPEHPTPEGYTLARSGNQKGLPVPASLDLSRVKSEIMAGDRLLPAPQRSFLNYAPHAPTQPVQASVVSIYGGDASMNWAAQSYVVAISRGTRDGVDNGTVLELISRGEQVVDKTGPNPKEILQLPSQRNGYAMVFMAFDRVSYALVMQVLRPVVVGDMLRTPQF